ncbi:diphthamide synthesis protein [Candidatus Woesearchaeota archaeon]|nr:diphthamide synthesis protein [Candidatus Woesearchaeota archaeon]
MFALELDRVIAEIKQRKSKLVLIQLPDGLKPRAKEIVDTIEKETGATTIIWLGSCFGACDIPLGLNTVGVELLIQWGHNFYHKSREGW